MHDMDGMGAEQVRILLVEDNQHDRVFFHRAFQRSGMQASITDCGRAEEALQRLSSRPLDYDVVVCDHGLPGSSGLELFRQLREVGLPHPFVLLTGRGGEDLAVEALKAGIDDYLPKRGHAYAAEELPQVIFRVAQAHRARLEKERAERELRCVEERFRLLIEAVQDYAIVMLDAAGHVTSWNPGAQRITGYRADEIIGQHLMVFYPAAAVRDGEPEQVLRAAVQEGKCEAEGWRLRRDGSAFWANDLVTAIRNEQGTLCGFAAVTRDFTERREAQQRLARNEARLAKAQRIAHLGSWCLELESNQLEWSDELYRILGLDPLDTAPTYSTLLAAFHREDQRAFESQIRRTVSTSETTIADYRVWRPSGEVRHVCSEICLDSGPDGRPQRLTGTIHDITERKREEVKARFLAETTSTALLAAIRDYDDTLLELARMSVPFFADCCLLQIIEDGEQRTLCDHAVSQREHLYKALEQGLDQRRACLLPARQAMQQRQPVLLNDVRVADLLDPAQAALGELLQQLGPGSVLALPLIVQDRLVGNMTFFYFGRERTYSPTDIPFAHNLATRAAIAVENARVYQDAREAARRKDEFLATLAHELRNPLAPVRNALEILRMAGDDEALSAKARNTIERQIECMVRLVDDLLDLSRIMRGKITLRRGRVALDNIIHRALETTAPQIHARRHELIVHMPQRDVWLEGDEVRLVQVVANLLHNAAKYTDAGGHIWLDCRVQDQQLQIFVRDDGIGMHPKMLSSIFDLFVQIDGSTERSHGGLGIGLTLVRRLVEMHGGSIAAYSQGEGTGSTFLVTLPLMIEDPACPQTAVLSGKRGSVPPAPSLRILVVDDNVDAADMLVDLLRLEGHEVVAAYSGEEALEKVETFTPQVALLDIGLPGISGYELARRLREEPRTAETHLIAITGFGQDMDRRRTAEAGFDHHLVKPVSPDELRVRLDRQAQALVCS